MVSWDGIRKELISLKEENYRKFCQKLITTKYPILGIRMPTLKKMARSLAKDFDKNLNLDFHPQFYEEILLYGFIIACLKCSSEDLYLYLDSFLPYVDNWAVCDSVCSATKALKQDLKKTLDHFLPLKKSEFVFHRRWLAVLLMTYFINDDFIDIVLDTYSDIKDGDYYVDMAIAWGLATAMVGYYDKVIKAIEDNRYSQSIVKKAMQKARDSRRVTI